MKAVAFLKKIFNHNIFVLSLFLGFIITLSVGIYSNAMQNGISNNLLRLHVIANSDSIPDQELKLKVRDAVINAMEGKFPNSKNIAETKEIAAKNLEYIKGISKDIIQSNGYNYDVRTSICNSYFPTKYYGNISLPAGNYEALKIEIGAALGANWWCVLFPPLCFTDVSSGSISDVSKEKLRADLTNEEYNLIMNSNGTLPVKIKFKSVEVFQKSKHDIEMALNKIL